MAPDTTSIPNTTQGELIRYGRLLIANTAYYLGPKGIVSHSSNGMNCQNCHLNAGTKPWGNNYSGVFSTYPKFRERRGAVENIFQRVNDCLERSLNGKSLDSNSREMQAVLAYIKWLGKEVPKGQKPRGSGIRQLIFMDRAADPQKGKIVFEKNCVLCHGGDGQGKMNRDSITYLYPPLWGSHSYNAGAGLYRLSRLAGYVKDNMPFGVTNPNAHLTEVEAWDVAAFVNSQPRPKKDLSRDWPDLSLKPIDHPFAPYTDSFSESQHKYGPFAAIQKAKESQVKKKPY
jgi:thiosulfate dehydrogenase